MLAAPSVYDAQAFFFFLPERLGSFLPLLVSSENEREREISSFLSFFWMEKPSDDAFMFMMLKCPVMNYSPFFLFYFLFFLVFWFSGRT